MGKKVVRKPMPTPPPKPKPAPGQVDYNVKTGAKDRNARTKQILEELSD